MSKTPESLDDYLNQVARELRVLPNRARDEELREIEAHLRALIEAHGGDEVGALKQFGPPRRVGRELRRAWEKKQPEAWWCAAGAVIFALDFFVFIALPMMQGFHRFHQYAQVNSHSIAALEVFLIHVQFLVFFLMFTVSYVMGLISPKRSYLGITAFLVTMSFPNSVNEIGSMSVGVLILFINFVVSAALGTYLGALHSRKISARIANTK